MKKKQTKTYSFWFLGIFFDKNIAMITLLFDRKWEHASLKLQGLRFFSCRLVEVNISHQSLVQHDKLFLWVSQNYTENNFDLVNKWVISKEKFVRDSSPPPGPDLEFKVTVSRDFQPPSLYVLKNSTWPDKNFFTTVFNFAMIFANLHYVVKIEYEDTVSAQSLTTLTR